MTKDEVINNEEPKTSGTERLGPMGNEGKTTNTSDDSPEPNLAGTGDSSNELSPVEISKKSHYDSENKKNVAKTGLYNLLKFVIPLFLAILIGLISAWNGITLYKIDKLSGPMNTLTEKVKNIENLVKKNQDNIEKTTDRLTDTREEFIKNSGESANIRKY